MKAQVRGSFLLFAAMLIAALGVARWCVRGDEGRGDAQAGTPAVARVPARRTGARGPGATQGTGSASQRGEVSKAQQAVIAELGWGSGPSQLGRERPREGNPEAPMSLAATPLGEVVVLDQVNGRLVVLGTDGKVLHTLPTTQQTPQDVTVAGDGTFLVLDRLRDKTVALIDPATGTLKGELPVEGKGIPHAGGITGTFSEGDSVYVEREHGALVRIGHLSGQVDSERPELPGRPTRDGRSYITAGIVEAASGRLYINAVDRQTGQHRYTREHRLSFPLMAITLLDTDVTGTIYLGVAGELPAGELRSAAEPGVRLLCLEPLDGRLRGQVDLPLNAMPEETFRDFAVLDEGGVVYQLRTESGVSLRRADCR